MASPLQNNITNLQSILNKVNSLPSAGSGGGDASATIDALLTHSITEITSNITEIASYALYGCEDLTIARFPEATSVGQSAFQSAMWLPYELYLPKARKIATQAFYCFGEGAYEREELIDIDLPVAGQIFSKAFYGAYFRSFILRSNTVCRLVSSDVFTYSSLEEIPPLDAYIYVPSALVTNYQSGSNWSNYADRIRPLEQYTVDGTTTGALDPNKI